jgi:hypothetical protein
MGGKKAQTRAPPPRSSKVLASTVILSAMRDDETTTAATAARIRIFRRSLRMKSYNPLCSVAVVSARAAIERRSMPLRLDRHVARLWGSWGALSTGPPMHNSRPDLRSPPVGIPPRTICGDTLSCSWHPGPSSGRKSTYPAVQISRATSHLPFEELLHRHKPVPPCDRVMMGLASPRTNRATDTVISTLALLALAVSAVTGCTKSGASPASYARKAEPSSRAGDP